MTQFQGRSTAITASARGGFAVTPSNDADLPQQTRGLYVGTSGHLAVQLLAGDSIVLKHVPGGTILPLRAVRVLATGTTAADIVGLF